MTWFGLTDDDGRLISLTNDRKTAEGWHVYGNVIKFRTIKDLRDALDKPEKLTSLLLRRSS